MKSNLWKLYTIAILSELMFLAVVIVPYLWNFWLSMSEVILTEIIFAFVIIIFEVPSWYFSDIYWRKLSLIIWAILVLIWIIFYSFWTTLLLFCIWWAFWWIWASFISWADQALLYETLVQLKMKDDYKRITWDIFFYWRLIAVFSWIIWWYLASLELAYPFYASIFPFIFVILVSLSLSEARHFEKQWSETWNHFKRIFKESFLWNKKIRYFIIYTWVLWFFSIDFWFKQKYLEFLWIPIIYYWVILWIVPIFSWLWWKCASSIEKYFWNKFTLLSIWIFPIFVWLAMWVSKTLMIIPFMIIMNFFWWLSVPIFSEYIQKLVTNDRRATIMSLMSLFRRLVFFISAPILWWVTDIYSIQTAFILIASLGVTFVWINVYFLKKVKII